MAEFPNRTKDKWSYNPDTQRIIGLDGKIIGGLERASDDLLAIEAVNNHDFLIAELARVTKQRDECVKALEMITKSAPTVNPELDSSVSLGSYDDVFWDGMTQQHWHDAEIARNALAQAKG